MAAEFASEFIDFSIEDGNRVRYRGSCDGTHYVLAKTNGVSKTIKWPKNVGTCTINFVSKDANGNEVKGSDQRIRSGESIACYTVPQGANRLVWYCEEDGESCLLELDR